MKTYIIFAHPNHNGLCYAAFEKARQGFTDAGHEVRVTDLYEERFDPLLFFDGEHLRRDLQFDEDTRIYRENILWAEHLVVIFPIWWGGMPAILKGFIDKVFAKGFAYDYTKTLPIGQLKGKTAWIINTHDTPSLYAKLFGVDYGKVLKRKVLAFCGIKTVCHTSMPSTRNSTIDQRRRWLDKIYRLASVIRGQRAMA